MDNGVKHWYTYTEPYWLMRIRENLWGFLLFYISILSNILQEAKEAYADKTREHQIFRNSAMFSRCDWKCTVNHLLYKKGYSSYLAFSRKALKHFVDSPTFPAHLYFWLPLWFIENAVFPIS